MAVKHIPTAKDFWPRYKKAHCARHDWHGITTRRCGATGGHVYRWIPRRQHCNDSIYCRPCCRRNRAEPDFSLPRNTPLKTLADAITHATGELSTVTPPNPNAHHFEASGLKPMLQHIYESAAGTKPTDAPQPAQTGDLLVIALNQASAGVVIMDDTGAIKLASKNAPIESIATA